MKYTSLMAIWLIALLAGLPACSSGSDDTDAGFDGTTEDANDGGAGDDAGQDAGGDPGSGDTGGDPGEPDGGDTGSDTGGDQGVTTFDLEVYLFAKDNGGDVTFAPDTYPTFEAGTSVTLTPVADPGEMFPFWLGIHRADVTDNGDGTYAIVMNENKGLIAVFAKQAVLGVEETGPLSKEGNMLLEFETVPGSDYEITFDDGTGDGYVNVVYDQNGEFYGVGLDDYFIEGPGTKALTAQGDAIYIEVADWGGIYSDGGTFHLTVNGDLGGPEIDINDPDAVPLVSGNTWEAEVDKDGPAVPFVFTIDNPGDQALALEGSAPDFVVLATTDPVTVTDQPGATIGAGGQDTFTVTVTPDGSEAIYQATLTIDNNDPDDGEDPFTLTLSVTSTSPSIEIFSEDFEGDGTFGGLDSGNTWAMSEANAVDPVLVNTDGPYDQVQQGTYSARLGTPESTTADRDPRTENDPPGSNEHSGLKVDLAVANDSTLTFWYWVETEDNYDTIWDFLGVYLDGAVAEENKFALTTSDPDHMWREGTVAIPAGTSTIEFKYTKDVNMTEYEDCAWIDSIVITED
jgi:hypothetical protein